MVLELHVAWKVLKHGSLEHASGCFIVIESFHPSELASLKWPKQNTDRNVRKRQYKQNCCSKNYKTTIKSCKQKSKDTQNSAPVDDGTEKASSPKDNSEREPKDVELEK
jgi:hypothetical protein